MPENRVGQQQSQITVFLDGQSLGVFETKSGGAATSDVSTRRAGGMGGQYAPGALATYEDLTVSRGFVRETDIDLARRLKPRTGRAKGSVSEQILDDDGNPYQRGMTYEVRLSGVNDGDGDSDTTDTRMLELTFTVLSVG